MARIDDYRKVVKRVLQEYAQSPSSGNIVMETIFDEIQDRYQLIALGWQGKKRIHGCLVHIDIKGDRVWIQHDSTDAEIARILVEMGIPASHIILGFHPEHYRQYSGFAAT